MQHEMHQRVAEGGRRGEDARTLVRPVAVRAPQPADDETQLVAVSVMHPRRKPLHALHARLLAAHHLATCLPEQAVHHLHGSRRERPLGQQLGEAQVRGDGVTVGAAWVWRADDEQWAGTSAFDLEDRDAPAPDAQHPRILLLDVEHGRPVRLHQHVTERHDDGRARRE